MTDSQTPLQHEALAHFDHLAREAATGSSSGTGHRIDTHANVVFLIGPLAYKMKRAVRFPFLDYSTLALREAACKAEITCNRHNAPQIYRRAVALRRDADGTLSLEGDGEIVEWVVEMNRFDTSAQLDRIAEQGPLAPELCERLARMMLEAHEQAPVHRDAGPGFLEELRSYISQNAQAFSEFPALFAPPAAQALTETADARLTELAPLLLRRGEAGHVRLCHGDAHARNIVLLDGKPVLFDAIEFSPAIATTDWLYDLAFLLMDLWDRDQKPAANRVFNRYLDLRTLTAPGGADQGDEDALRLLPFYLMMRACIRAKIAAAASLNQEGTAEKTSLEAEARGYFALAQAFLGKAPARLVAIGGLSGSGKSTLARALACDVGPAPGARILRTDVERKAHLGLRETDKAPAEAYTAEAAQAIYDKLDQRIRRVLGAGHAVIFDAVFARDAQRRDARDLATGAGASFLGLWLDAPADVLKARVTARTGDASDADADVVAFQLTLDTGTLEWPRLDASHGPEATLAQARQVLGTLS
ncbi:AAA family ATPase [Roseibium aestuarii]|uniref:AAA family ATPase n=1 Tax=Roseibium aestuarii TaxID=2600299 RepID=A0ABW4JTC4_9HYPH|nr:bifunctional aminoglycoside phosphotransferase/ATP-binding protein [Roseibium aestuarii]